MEINRPKSIKPRTRGRKLISGFKEKGRKMKPCIVYVCVTMYVRVYVYIYVLVLVCMYVYIYECV